MAIPPKLQPWIDARQRFRLSDAHIQMARELGMNPKKLGRLANHKQEPWKAPLPDFIEACYYKSFGKRRPDNVRSIERMVKEQNARKRAKKARKVEQLTREQQKVVAGIAAELAETIMSANTADAARGTPEQDLPF
jgi:hypothetical protein